MIKWVLSEEDKRKIEEMRQTQIIESRQKAEDFRFKAIKFYGANNLYGAIDCLHDSIKQTETAEAYALLAYYTQKLKHDEQRTTWKDIYYGIFNNDYENVLFLYNKALSLDEKNITANFGICDYYINNRNYQKALPTIIAALKLEPDNLDLHNNLGLCLLNTNRIQESIMEFLLVADKKRDEVSYINLSAAFFENKDYNNSIRFSKLALEINPNSSNAKLILDKSIQYKKNPPVRIREQLYNILNKPTSILFLIATIINLAGLNDMPYGFYILLRLITCGVCVYSAVKFKLEWAKWIFGGLAVLYNPILPVHLGDKEAWIFVNFATIAYMWLALYFETKKEKIRQ